MTFLISCIGKKIFEGTHSAPAMALTRSKRNPMRSHFNQMSRSFQLRYGGHDFRRGSPLTSLKGVLRRFFAKSERSKKNKASARFFWLLAFSNGSTAIRLK